MLLDGCFCVSFLVSEYLERVADPSWAFAHYRLFVCSVAMPCYWLLDASFHGSMDDERASFPPSRSSWALPYYWMFGGCEVERSFY